MTQFTDQQVGEFVRFMTKVAVPDRRGGCWNWTGNKPGGRHGHFSVGYKAIKAHRWIYEFFHGPIPEGLIVRHKCDNSHCVNPEHLEVGTHADNTADMFERGRNPDRKGESHPLCKLTAEQVIQIRNLKACGFTEKALAERFGIGRGQVGKIVRRENWRHI